MRFSQIRSTLIKGINTPSDNVLLRGHEPEFNPSTPRWLSPFEDRVAMKLRQGVNPADVPQPQHNRQSRRANGFKRPRIGRVRGVALKSEAMPWKP